MHCICSTPASEGGQSVAADAHIEFSFTRQLGVARRRRRLVQRLDGVAAGACHGCKRQQACQGHGLNGLKEFWSCIWLPAGHLRSHRFSQSRPRLHSPLLGPHAQQDKWLDKFAFCSCPLVNCRSVWSVLGLRGDREPRRAVQQDGRTPAAQQRGGARCGPAGEQQGDGTEQQRQQQAAQQSSGQPASWWPAGSGIGGGMQPEQQLRHCRWVGRGRCDEGSDRRPGAASQAPRP